jgi:phosphonate transport system substrate-binding protein
VTAITVAPTCSNKIYATISLRYLNLLVTLGERGKISVQEKDKIQHNYVRIRKKHFKHIFSMLLLSPNHFNSDCVMNGFTHQFISVAGAALPSRISRRWLLGLMFLAACRATSSSSGSRSSLLVGAVNYEGGDKTVEQYDRFTNYLSEKTQSLVQIEPALNESRALNQIRNQAWSLVFAPPGLSAIAISQYQYTPLFPLFGVQNLRSVLVVREDSPLQNIKDITGKAVALGKPGSATGYYLPIFNLYGLTLSELVFPTTPDAILEAVSQGKAAMGAVSMEEFNQYRSQVTSAKLRILFADPHPVPPGTVLISPTLERNYQESIRKILSEMPSVVAEEAGFVTNAAVPDYKYMISVVDRVRSIFPGDTPEGVKLLQQKPVRLFK